ncbi:MULTISPECIES: hypothetical protein [unclassified Ruegeria]|uniref:hypothetical protein n=1 Tax=unclassified Ruegeria TaxID=2625375 RepID=UPI00147E1AB6|nr:MULTISPECIES: hypothetical protein [unclassified Ruegeria]
MSNDNVIKFQTDAVPELQETVSRITAEIHLKTGMANLNRYIEAADWVKARDCASVIFLITHQLSDPDADTIHLRGDVSLTMPDRPT